jgi:deoxyribodipyrimidine photo-lyase
MKINIFCFRNDLRLEDNTALQHALSDGIPVLPVYIFDNNITEDLPENDPGKTFIYDNLNQINKVLQKSGSSLHVKKGDPQNVWRELTKSFDVNAVYVNKDYDPYTISGDLKTEDLLQKKGIHFLRYKDRVIFEEKEVVKTDTLPYTIFTPYKNKWLNELAKNPIENSFVFQNESGLPTILKGIFYQEIHKFPSLEELGFERSRISVNPYDLSAIKVYDKYRNIPALDRTTHLGPHLRFGTVSIRKIVEKAAVENTVFLSELIWREFFIQILFNFPYVVTGNFRTKYNSIPWRNNEEEFQKWCAGETGFPIVDAGMRQLNETGYMHNRVRMIASGFLCKHLLTDWRLGEAYFATKLLDYELASNNGNWQWAAGTGCDAAPYFRVFNPQTQQKKFDPKYEYVRQWVKNFDQSDYPQPMVDHDFARKRALDAYKR